MNGVKKTISTLLAFLLAFITAMGALLGGLLLTEHISHTLSDILCGVLGLVLILLTVGSYIGAVVFIGKKKGMRVADGHRYLEEKKGAIRSDLDRATRHLVRTATFCRLSLLLALLLSHATMFFIGVSKNTVALFSLIAVYVIFGVYNRFLAALLFRPKLDEKDCLSREDFPLVYAVAERAREAAGLSGKVSLVSNMSHDASILRLGRGYAILLGSSLLCSESEEELYNILLHEFAHVTDSYAPKTISPFFHRLMGQDSEGNGISVYAEAFLALPAALYAWEHVMYNFLASEFIEEKADAIIKEKGDPVTFASALAKCVLHSHFERLSGIWLTEPLYAPEQMRRDHASRYYKAFCQGVLQKGEEWLDSLETEIQSKSASHPIFRTRRNAVGVKKEEIRIVFPDPDTPFAKEALAILAYVDDKLYCDNKDDYAEARRVNYLRPLAIVESWNEQGRSLSADDTIPVVEALCQLNRHDEAEGICDELIASVKNPASTAYYRFVKAHRLLERDDDSGIALMYEVIDLNANFLQEGLNAIGEYCCRRGLQKELDEYRAKAADIMQRGIDEHDPAGVLTHKDNLVKDDMDKESLQGHIAFMLSAGGEALVSVYLVRKIITDTYFSRVFVVELAPDTDGETVNDVMDKIFRHLDTDDSDEQYSLFLMNDYYRRIVKKVPDSCVWVKNA